VNNDNFTPQEQALIDRLGRAPQPELSPSALDSIHARLMDALDNPPPVINESPGGLPVSTPVIVAAVAIVVVLVTVIIISISNPPAPEQPIITPSQTALPSATPEPSLTPITPTVTPSLVPTSTFAAEIISTVEFTPTATLTNTPTLTLTTVPASTTPTVTADVNPVIVIEGPVQSINVNIITIYNINITIDPADPLLTTVKIGDNLRVEADFQANTTLIVAISVTYVNTETVNSNPNTGEVWRDNGGCDNPPPDWAPANGWRRRCQGGNPPGGGNNNDRGNNDESSGSGSGSGSGR
jgi:hypothetical protein